MCDITFPDQNIPDYELRGSKYDGSTPCKSFLLPVVFNYDYSPQTHELSEQRGFDDNGKGIEGPLLSGQVQRKVSRKKQPGELEQGEGGRGRKILPLHFFSSVFFSSSLTRHYIQPTCISERLVWNSLNQYKLSLVFILNSLNQYKLPLVFILDRAFDTSQISFPNLPSPGFVILQHQVMIFSPNAYQQDKFCLDT